jgi:hypothetical protein
MGLLIIADDAIEIAKLSLKFLMMAAALESTAGGYELCHAFVKLIGSR